MITLDTSAVVALLDADEAAHERVVEALRDERPPLLVPAAILCEVGYFVQRRLGTTAIAAFLEDLGEGQFRYDPGETDLVRIRELVVRYADLPLGVADAAVVACAERSGRRVMTLDRRDFEVVGREVALTLVP
ncbi:MAG: PIN domain-containing protein [Chloroflexota bacterium]